MRDKALRGLQGAFLLWGEGSKGRERLSFRQRGMKRGGSGEPMSRKKLFGLQRE